MINYEHTLVKLPDLHGEQISKVGCGFQHTLLISSTQLSIQTTTTYTDVGRPQITSFSL